MADSKPAPKKEKFVPSVTDPDKEFSPDYFASRNDYLRQLSQINPTTPEGLEKYLAIYPTAVEGDSKYMSSMLEGMAQQESGRITQFARKNAKSLVGLLEPQDAMQLALQTPSFRSKESPLADPVQEKARQESEKAYNALATTIETSQKRLNTIRTNPHQYIAELFEKYKVKPDSVFGAFVLGNIQEFLQQHQRMISTEVQTRLSKYGPAKYLTQLYKTASGLERMSDAQKADEKKLSEAQQEFDLAKGKEAKEKAVAKLEEARKKYTEKYSQQLQASQVMPQFIEKLSESAYESIMIKKARDEAEKKAKEKK